MNASKIIVISLAVLLVGSLFPTVVNNLVDAEEPEASDTFTAASASADQEVFTLTNIPVVSGSEDVSVNSSPVTPPGDYTINNTTGEITTASGTTDTGDTVDVDYNYIRDLGDLWPALIIVIVAGVVFWLWRRLKPSGVS